MPVKIVHNNYGKSRVRLLKVERTGEGHFIQNLTLNIALEGDFDEIHTAGDNSKCLPTDTMKNTVYALAAQKPEIEDIEKFGTRLANHFLETCSHISRVFIDISEHGWNRATIDGELHSHAFLEGSTEKRTTRIDAGHGSLKIESGIVDLIVLKTTGSGFAGYIKDSLTTLPETTDRIFSTSIEAVWKYKSPEDADSQVWSQVRQAIIEVFADHNSKSVQHTMYAMGKTVLEQFPEVEEIAFSLPNIHFLPFDLSRFGMENDNRIFLPTDEPHGLIEARFAR